MKQRLNSIIPVFFLHITWHIILAWFGQFRQRYLQWVAFQEELLRVEGLFVAVPPRIEQIYIELILTSVSEVQPLNNPLRKPAQKKSEQGNIWHFLDPKQHLLL